MLKSTELLIPVVAHDEEEPHLSRRPRARTPIPNPPQSLADELLSKGEDTTLSLKPNNGEIDVRSVNGTMTGEEEGGEVWNSDNGVASNVEYDDEDSYEELLVVDPQMITEVEMLQKENELWETEQRQLEMEKRTLREQKDAFERYLPHK